MIPTREEVKDNLFRFVEKGMTMKNVEWETAIDELYDIIEKQEEEKESPVSELIRLSKEEPDVWKYMLHDTAKDVEIEDLRAKLAHYEDNVVVHFDGRADRLKNGRTVIDYGIDRFFEHSKLHDGKKYKVIVLEAKE